MSDLFAHARAQAAARKPRRAPRREAIVPHRCAICGAFAPYGRGLPHRGERVVYYCREHEPK